MPSKPRRGVLLDVDGTLVDTNFLHTVCWAEALRQQGHRVTAADVHHAMGMGSDRLLNHVLGEDHDHDGDAEIVAAHKTLYKQWWGRLVTMPGAADLVRGCAERGLAVVFASSASEEELEALRSTLEVDDSITSATSKGDAETSKPAPDILAAALDRADLQPADVVFVGDAVWDGEAARKAGLGFLGLTCGGTPREDLESYGAEEVWEDPADLLANLDRSMIGRLLAG
jgi:HAD superfamily hydrolase (TIGR01509 family)